jgi:arginine dihydrolase
MIPTVLICRPSYFDVNYCINPWMDRQIVNQAKAFKQWHNLLKIYQLLNIKVHIVEQERHLSDMVFATDCGLVFKNTFIPANFTYPQRKLEKYPYHNWFSLHNFKTLPIPQRSYFEGGDCILTPQRLILGTGFRTQKTTSKFLSSIINLPTLCLDLISPQFYHLDTCFIYINPTTALYFPNAFSKNSQKTLAELFINLIPINKTEAKTLVTNSVIFSQNIIVPTQTNQRLTNILTQLSLNIFKVNVDEFSKAGGGIHCLTNIFHQ